MKKNYIICLLFFYSVAIAQSLQIVTVLDSETNNVIPQTRLIWNDNVFYTNDDGQVLIPSDAKDIKISAPNYQEIKLNDLHEIIKLEPKYTEIPEVIIKSIDIKNVFENILKNYDKFYGTQQSAIYDISIKQKAKNSDKLNNLFVADMNLWTSDGQYHFGEKNLYNFAQMSIDKIRYYQTRKLGEDDIFNNDINIRPQDFIQKIFLNAELSGILNDTKNYKIGASVVSEDDDTKTIIFKSEKIEETGADFSGELLLNKPDNAIAYLKIDINQSKTVSEKTNKKGEKYTRKTIFASLVYEFYKKDNKYIPTRYEITGKGTDIYKNNESPFEFFQEIIYKSSKKGNKKGLKNKIDLAKGLTENIPANEIKDSKTLLSTEEQQFVDEP